MILYNIEYVKMTQLYDMLMLMTSTMALMNDIMTLMQSYNVSCYI